MHSEWLDWCSLSVDFAVATVRNRSQHVRSDVAKPHHLGNGPDPAFDDVRIVDFVANRLLMLRFETCVKVGVCILSGRGNTLEACQRYRVLFSWQAPHFLLAHCQISWQAYIVS